MEHVQRIVGTKAIAKNWNCVRTTLSNAGFDNADTGKSLLITAAQIFDLGSGCKETLMVQFDNKPQWFVLNWFKRTNDD